MDMCHTCLYAENMSKMIQIRDVPEQIHGILKARAAREGMSLSDYLKKELEQVAERPSTREWLELTQKIKPVSSKRSGAQVIRELRDAR
jgi:plasmid stability protein